MHRPPVRQSENADNASAADFYEQENAFNNNFDGTSQAASVDSRQAYQYRNGIQQRNNLRQSNVSSLSQNSLGEDRQVIKKAWRAGPNNAQWYQIHIINDF